MEIIFIISRGFALNFSIMLELKLIKSYKFYKKLIGEDFWN